MSDTRTTPGFRFVTESYCTTDKRTSYRIRDTHSGEIVREDLVRFTADITTRNMNAGAQKELGRLKAAVTVLLTSHVVVGRGANWSIKTSQRLPEAVIIVRSDGQVVCQCATIEEAHEIIVLAKAIAEKLETSGPTTLRSV